MRLAIIIVFVLALLPPCGFAAPPYRELREIDISVFSCTPNPTHFAIRSQSELARVLGSLAPHCLPADFDQRKAAFLRDLDEVHFDWADETLMIASDWYGTGMAKPQLVFNGPTRRVLTATIVWKVPPPPVTPDTASCRFAFAVRRSEADTVKVVGQNSGTVTFAVSH